ncbi:hypothetical protein GIB67_011188, partial [Kingdonia uniflora]
VENPSCSRLFDSNFKSLVHKWRILHAQGYLIQSSSLFDSKAGECHNNQLRNERDERRQELEGERQRHLDDYEWRHHALDELCHIVRELQQGHTQDVPQRSRLPVTSYISARARPGPYPKIEVPPVNLYTEGTPTVVPTNLIHLDVPVTEDSSNSTLRTSRYPTRHLARECLSEGSAEHAPFPRPPNPQPQ